MLYYIDINTRFKDSLVQIFNETKTVAFQPGQHAGRFSWSCDEGDQWSNLHPLEAIEALERREVR